MKSKVKRTYLLLPMEEDTAFDYKAPEGVLINHHLTITLINDKRFVQDFKVEDVNMTEQVLLVSSLEEKNVAIASLEEISNKPEFSNKEVQSIIDSSFISNDMVKMMHEAQVKETSIVLEDDKLDMVLPIIREAKQIDLEDLEIINIVMSITIEDKKVVFEEDLAKKVKFNKEHIEQSMKNYKKDLLMV